MRSIRHGNNRKMAYTHTHTHKTHYVNGDVNSVIISSGTHRQRSYGKQAKYDN